MFGACVPCWCGVQHVRKLADLMRVEWDGMDQAMEHRDEEIKKEVSQKSYWYWFTPQP
jgi:hypothetical protein